MWMYSVDVGWPCEGGPRHQTRGHGKASPWLGVVVASICRKGPPQLPLPRGQQPESAPLQRPPMEISSPSHSVVHNKDAGFLATPSQSHPISAILLYVCVLYLAADSFPQLLFWTLLPSLPK